MTVLHTLRRLHVWLAWFVGVPLLFWTLSGLWMAARPIEEVRGTALRAAPAALVLPATLVPPAIGRPIRTLALEMQAGRAVWVVGLGEGAVIRADAAAGRPLAPPTRAEAAAIARAARVGSLAIVAMHHTPATAPPIDLRRPRPAWGVTFADDTRVYVDADSGTVLALRTEQWRWFDWMWGLHIMDLGGREATHHAILIAFAALALLGTLVGLVLLPFTGRYRRRT